MNFAIISTGGKQYLVQGGDTVRVEKLQGKEGDVVTFDQVLALGDESSLQAGTPTVSGKKVSGTIVKQGRNTKVHGVKFKNKTRYVRTFGHRQPFTEIKISNL